MKEQSWKDCIPQKGIGGSNPPLSAKFYIQLLLLQKIVKKCKIARHIVCVWRFVVAEGGKLSALLLLYSTETHETIM